MAEAAAMKQAKSDAQAKQAAMMAEMAALNKKKSDEKIYWESGSAVSQWVSKWDSAEQSRAEQSNVERNRYHKKQQSTQISNNLYALVYVCLARFWSR